MAFWDWENNATRYRREYAYAIYRVELTVEKLPKHEGWAWHAVVQRQDSSEVLLEQKGTANTAKEAQVQADIAVDNWENAKLPSGSTLLTIPSAAKKAGVPRQTLLWAVNNEKLPYMTINHGSDTSFKVVALEDVIEWNKHRKPSNAGRKKSAK